MCPPPPFEASPVPSGANATRIEGLPPSDDFLGTSSDVTILEGPVWFEGNLYVSQINDGPPSFGIPGGFPGQGMGGAGGMGQTTSTRPPPARVLKVTESGAVSIAIADSGTNGLAIDPKGNLVGCSHKTGSVARLSLSGAAPVDLVSDYMGARFDSPNDLAFGSDGSLYFTDPDYQAPSPAPQAATRAYRVAPGTTTAIPIVEGQSQPNGITFSPDRKILYISSSDGVSSYPVMTDGSLGTATRFAQGVVRSSDGMGMDCAGNLYTTSNQDVIVVGPSGAEVGRISVPGVQSVTNVAFGGANNRTLYITALGTGTRSGVFKTAVAIPGMPY